jgi:hypothetical protein
MREAAGNRGLLQKDIAKPGGRSLGQFCFLGPTGAWCRRLRGIDTHAFRLTKDSYFVYCIEVTGAGSAICVALSYTGPLEKGRERGFLLKGEGRISRP